MKFFLSLTLTLWSIFSLSFAQNNLVSFKVTNQYNQEVSNAAISISGSLTINTSSDADGTFSIPQPEGEILITVTHLEYNAYSQTFEPPFSDAVTEIILISPNKLLEQVEIFSQKHNPTRNEAGITELDPKHARNTPSAFGDFTSVLASLPGVFAGNELSSAYNVRGGNFEENLVYVNDIPVYRPFLVTAGQQEGLSFVNPDMVDNIRFSAGGWQAQYGDRLSSSLNVEYRKPEDFAAGLNIGLLGGNAYAQGVSSNKRTSYLVGLRHKSSRYLLNTLDVEGQYFPQFTDIQILITHDLSKEKNGKTTLSGLSSYARNRYQLVPELQETSFGTLNDPLRLTVAFGGNEFMSYDTYQQAFKLSHHWTESFQSDLILSAVLTKEREFQNIEAAYRLCDVLVDPNDPEGQDCAAVRGVGSYFNYGRNSLEAGIFSAEWRNEYKLRDNQNLKFGISITHENINDALNEYRFADSSGFVSITEQVNSEASLLSNRVQAFLQHSASINDIHQITYGIRLHHWSLNNQLIVSPRLQYAIAPEWRRDFVFRMATGLYQQPPFYRELRNFSGQLNENLLAQRSWHNIVGFDYNFQMWDRPFKLIVEGYYKYMDRIVPYDIDNLRLRYYGENLATAYATGIDFRLSGEFIPGAESWFSLGLMQSRENVEGDPRGYIPRPTDQLINLGIFFQDHLPNDPSLKLRLNLAYATGLPFGPPSNVMFRNVFNATDYKRVDIGVFKHFNMNEDRLKLQPKTVAAGVEILNLFANNNVMSYSWISDVNNVQFAVPNVLSARFLNIKLSAEF